MVAMHAQSTLVSYDYFLNVMIIIENKASTISTSLIPEDAPIYRYSMCNGTEYSFNRCQLPRSDSNSTCPSIGVVNCTEGVINI